MEISVTWVCGQSYAFTMHRKWNQRPSEFISAPVLIQVLAIIHIQTLSAHVYQDIGALLP